MLELGGAELDDLRVEHHVSVDHLTGAASIHAPFPISEGRAGFGPALALSYASGGGGSPFGIGWTLVGVPAITVSSRRGLPRYDGTDRYALGGGEELAPTRRKTGGKWEQVAEVRGPHAVQRYTPVLGNGRVRIERGSSLPAAVCTGGRAIRMTFLPCTGCVRTTRVGSSTLRTRHTSVLVRGRPARSLRQRDPVRVRAGNRRRRESVASVCAWSVAEGATLCQADQLRQHASGSCRCVGSGGKPMALPSRVRLWRPRHGSASARTRCSVAGSARRLPVYRGFEVRTVRLCRRILQFHHFDELGTDPVRVQTIALDHDEDPAGTTLTGITVTGHRSSLPLTGPASRSLPTVTFTYTQPEVADSFTRAPESAGQLMHGLADGATQYVDLYGEGVPGVLVAQRSSWWYHPNEGGGAFGERQLVPAQPAERLGRGVALSDFDRDGNTDVVALQGRSAGFYELDRETGEWSGHRPFAAIPHLEAPVARTEWLDLDGDGRPDLVVNGEDRFTWYRSLGKDGFEPARTIMKPDPDRGPSLLVEDPGLDLFFADMSGDGLPDLVRAGNGRLEFFPNLGHGHFGNAVVLDGAPRFADGGEFDPSRLRFVDLDGSGTCDLVYIGHGELRWWINAEATSWCRAGASAVCLRSTGLPRCRCSTSSATARHASFGPTCSRGPRRRSGTCH